MNNQKSFDELKDYGEKFGQLLQGLKQHDGLLQEQYSERELVLEHDKLKLYHYVPDQHIQKTEADTAQTDQVQTPVLIVYALVNRPSILDLQQGHSAIAQMLKSGLDVYLIDWGYPDASDKHLDLDYYINTQIDACVDLICDTTNIKQVSLMGICQGGVLGLCYSSLHPQRVKSLVTLVTPVDFHTEPDTLSNLVRHVDIDLMVKTMGNIPGDMLSSTFLSLRPYYLQLKKYLNLVESTAQLDEKTKERIANFILMERWIFDSPDQAGEAFREFVQGCYQQNRLIKNTLKVGGCQIDLSTLNIPVLNIYADQDHLVPPASSKALENLIPANQYQEMSVNGGHIGIFVSPKSVKAIFPAIADWLRKHS
ncbi:class III poly(R)-hydroxyalkanoic acid synthase subunit PhaC [Cocleimonas flava]|uniref:Poly(3-hydroxyalkanoate) polymerase subunit PhaC n=1 Tax=Cocleimonas flava TaxID=634765 RepID=A0A4V2P8X9_9GAMM|nr:class III poly(R)-hydroxyalkanoic acid synthase subunit PhaC [Cocleimonas flava]TCJ87465.1 polyhydroxyalkanoate synthase [Cocleimonas flava]